MKKEEIGLIILKETHRFNHRLVDNLFVLIELYGIEMVRVLINFHESAINQRIERMEFDENVNWHSGVSAINYLIKFKHLFARYDDPIGHMIKKSNTALNRCKDEFTICNRCYITFWDNYYAEDLDLCTECRRGACKQSSTKPRS